MKRKIVVFAMLIATTLFWIPADNTVSAQRGQNKSHKSDRGRNFPGLWDDRQRGKKWNQGRKKDAHGYRNYGQYRRTQVGNRRYRLVKRSYWNDGIRLSRLVRVYY